MKLEIISTSHIAQESINAVRERIFEKKPDIVAVELDSQRFPNLFSEQKKPKIRDLLRLGLAGFLLYVLGNFVQRNLGERVGVMPGADIREAVKAAMQTQAKLFLIDQPITITLQKLSKQIGFFEKIKLVFYLLGGFLFSSEEQVVFDLKKVPEAKIINLLRGKLMKEFPSIYKVLVEERDVYMANQLIAIQKKFPDADIVAVVGAGHLRGLRKLLKSKNS